MKKVDLGQAIAILANLGVIGGLIFVGLQLRQDQKIASSDAILAASQRQYQIVEVIGQNPEIWFKGVMGQPLSETEELYFEEMAQARLLTAYATWNTANELFGADQAERWVRELAHRLKTSPGLRRYWESRMTELEYTSGPLDAREFDRAVKAELEKLLGDGK